MIDLKDKWFFNRSYAVTLNEAGQPGQKYTQLKVAFEIEKSRASHSNKAKIDIVNLSAKSRSQWEKKGIQIRLEAGYEGLTEDLFLGDVAKVFTKRSGPDIITTFEAGDSERALTNSHFERSYPAQTLYSQIIKDIANSLGVSIGPLVGLPTDYFQKGISFSKSSRSALDALTEGTGLEWSIQNGALQILPIQGHTGAEAVVLKSDTGLIGVPSNKNNGIEFTALLNPKLLPGSPVQVISNTINGYFKLGTCTFEGDSHGDKWQVRCEATETKAKQIFSTTGFIGGNSVGTTA